MKQTPNVIYILADDMGYGDISALNENCPFQTPNFDAIAENGIAFIDAYIADNPVYWVYCDLVNQSKDAVAKSSDLNALVDTISNNLTCSQEPRETPDMAHYDSMSQIKLGHLFIEELNKYLDK